MKDISTIKASDMIRDSYSIKSHLKDTWDYADNYYNNIVNSVSNFKDTTKLAASSMEQGFVENLIPQLMRTYAASVVSQKFDIMTEPFGSKNDPMNLMVAKTVQDCLRYFSSRPKSTAIRRDLAIRMKMYNAVALVDYYDDMNDEPAVRLIPHTDIFFDPTAKSGVNDTGGPRTVALRLVLTPDEAINRYGPDRVASMPRGLIGLGSDTQESMHQGKNYYNEMYDVFELYGYDYTLVSISEQENRSIADAEISEWINGNQVQVDADIDHEMAINEGIRIANEQLLGNERDDEIGPEAVLSQLAEQGLGQIADALYGWMEQHQAFIDDGDEGGSRAKYDDFVYKAEFQHGESDWLMEPTELGYSHGQIPISFFRNHENTDGLFGAGPFTEVMNLHRRYERFRAAITTYVDMVSRPPFIVDLDLIAPEYADAEKRKGLLNALKSGFRALFIRSSNSPGAREPGFAKMPPMSYDTHREVSYIEYKIQEIIGPTPVMKGDVSGEVSGKAFQLRQQSSAIPMSDVNTQMEGGLQGTYNRWGTYIIDYLPFEKIANISGPEGANLMEQLRDSGIYPECLVNTRFGQDMPMDWQIRNPQAWQAYQMGLIDENTLTTVSSSPFKLNKPAPPPVTGQASAGMQGVTQ